MYSPSFNNLIKWFDSNLAFLAPEWKPVTSNDFLQDNLTILTKHLKSWLNLFFSYDLDSQKNLFQEIINIPNHATTQPVKAFGYQFIRSIILRQIQHANFSIESLAFIQTLIDEELLILDKQLIFLSNDTELKNAVITRCITLFCSDNIQSRRSIEWLKKIQLFYPILKEVLWHLVTTHQYPLLKKLLDVYHIVDHVFHINFYHEYFSILQYAFDTNNKDLLILCIQSGHWHGNTAHYNFRRILLARAENHQSLSLLDGIKLRYLEHWQRKKCHAVYVEYILTLYPWLNIVDPSTFDPDSTLRYGKFETKALIPLFQSYADYLFNTKRQTSEEVEQSLIDTACYIMDRHEVYFFLVPLERMLEESTGNTILLWAYEKKYYQLLSTLLERYSKSKPFDPLERYRLNNLHRSKELIPLNLLFRKNKQGESLVRLVFNYQEENKYVKTLFQSWLIQEDFFYYIISPPFSEDETNVGLVNQYLESRNTFIVNQDEIWGRVGNKGNSLFWYVILDGYNLLRPIIISDSMRTQPFLTDAVLSDKIVHALSNYTHKPDSKACHEALFAHPTVIAAIRRDIDGVTTPLSVLLRDNFPVLWIATRVKIESVELLPGIDEDQKQYLMMLEFYRLILKNQKEGDIKSTLSIRELLKKVEYYGLFDLMAFYKAFPLTALAIATSDKTLFNELESDKVTFMTDFRAMLRLDTIFSYQLSEASFLPQTHEIRKKLDLEYVLLSNQCKNAIRDYIILKPEYSFTPVGFLHQTVMGLAAQFDEQTVIKIVMRLLARLNPVEINSWEAIRKDDPNFFLWALNEKYYALIYAILDQYLFKPNALLDLSVLFYKDKYGQCFFNKIRQQYALGNPAVTKMVRLDTQASFSNEIKRLLDELILTLPDDIQFFQLKISYSERKFSARSDAGLNRFIGKFHDELVHMGEQHLKNKNLTLHQRFILSILMIICKNYQSKHQLSLSAYSLFSCHCNDTPEAVPKPNSNISDTYLRRKTN